MIKSLTLASLISLSHLMASSQTVNASNVNIDGASGNIKLLITGNDASYVGADIVIKRSTTATGVGNGATIQMENATGTNAHIIQGSDAGIQFFNGGSSVGNWNEHMRIAMNGFIGIGTTSPMHRLEVNGQAVASKAIVSQGMNDSWTGGASYLGYNPNDGSGRLGSYDYSTSSWKNLILNEGGGNIGIGTSTPAYKLDVNGNAIFRGGLDAFGESHLYLGNYIDPHPGFGYALKIGAGGMAINGNSIFQNGFVGIGTTNPQSELAVKGTITSMKVKVTQTGWADYVFDSSYRLTPLHHIEKFIQTNKHLPDVPSATEVEKNGLDLGDNQAVLLKKIEELTLYIIQQNKQLIEQNRLMSELERRVVDLEAKQAR